MGAVRATVEARTPEDLGTLLEDALITRDRDVLAALFEPAAVVFSGCAPARGREEIARIALATWRGERAYVATPCLVVQARDLALVMERGGMLQVARRTGGAWRYAIVLRPEEYPEGVRHDPNPCDRCANG